MRQTQMKAQKHSALCVCAAMLDLIGLPIDIYSFFLSVTRAGQGAAQPLYAFKFSIFILFFNTGYLVCSQSELVKAAFGTIKQDSPKGS